MSKKPHGVMIGVLALALGLTGCAPALAPLPTTTPVAGPTIAPTPTPTLVVTPTPTSTATAAVDPSVLFTMTATAVASGSNGATEDLAETVYAPTARTADPIGDTKLLAKQCPGYQKWYPKIAYMVFTMTATPAAGSVAWPKDAVQIFMYGGSAISGDGTGFEAECAGAVIIDVPGKVHAVTVIEAGDRPDSRFGWAKMEYGFDIAVDGPKSSIPAKDRVEFTNCAITLGAAAAADPIASTWVTKVAQHKDTDRSCAVGSG